MNTTNFVIYGRYNGKRGGTFQGFLKENGKPVFGGSNLIYAPVWWNTKKEKVQEICNKIIIDFPEVFCKPKQIN
jgi:hypothetical protein